MFTDFIGRRTEQCRMEKVDMVEADRSFGDVFICFDILKLICETDATLEGDRREPNCRYHLLTF